MSRKLLTKKVPFQGKQLTMYSIDGVTWSTRSEELQAIIDRHSFEQAGFGADLKGEEKEKAAAPKPRPKKFNRVHNDDELDEIIDDDMKDEEIPADINVDVEDDEADDEADVAPKKPLAKKAATAKTVEAKIPENKVKKAAEKKAVAPLPGKKNSPKPKLKTGGAKPKPVVKGKTANPKKPVKPVLKVKPKIKKK